MNLMDFFYMKYPEFKELYAAKLFNLRNAFSTIIQIYPVMRTIQTFAKKVKFANINSFLLNYLIS